MNLFRNLLRKLFLFVEYLKYRAFLMINPKYYPSILSKTYYRKLGVKLNFDNPRRYTEKMQVFKLYYSYNQVYTDLTDKFSVRQWIEKIIGNEYLVPLIGVYNSFREIDFDLLPNSFVMKMNNGSGTNIIVKDKSKFDKKRAQMLFSHWSRINYFYKGVELQYKNIKPLILIEEYLGSDDELYDYKFLCFNGIPYFCWVDFNRSSNHTRNVYNMNWSLQNWNQRNYGNFPGNLPKPKNFENMKEIATLLSKGFGHVRVDLYIKEERVFFGEMTFTNGGGFEGIYPDEFDFVLGNLWNIEGEKQI